MTIAVIAAIVYGVTFFSILIGLLGDDRPHRLDERFGAVVFGTLWSLMAAIFFAVILTLIGDCG